MQSKGRPTPEYSCNDWGPWNGSCNCRCIRLSAVVISDCKDLLICVPRTATPKTLSIWCSINNKHQGFISASNGGLPRGTPEGGLDSHDTVEVAALINKPANQAIAARFPCRFCGDGPLVGPCKWIDCVMRRLGAKIAHLPEFGIVKKVWSTRSGWQWPLTWVSSYSDSWEWTLSTAKKGTRDVNADHKEKHAKQLSSQADW